VIDIFKDRTRLAEALDPNSHRLVTGTPNEMQQARLEHQRALHAQGIIRRWDEIPRSRLVFGRYWIEDTQTGNFYKEFGGDPGYAQSVVAHYVRSDGTPVMLEPADPPSRAELERRQARKEQRRLEREAESKERRRQLNAVAGR
jgi:hypothetical protein